MREDDSFANEEDMELLGFAQELETMLGPVPPRDERRMRAYRSMFLTIAAEELSPPPSRWHGLWRRLSLQGTCMMLMLGIFWMSARATSASSLPGDSLYPVKLTVERIDGLFYGQDQWERQVQSQRLAEVLALVHSRGVAEVDFQGTLTQAGDGSWHIGGIPLKFGPEAQLFVENLCGPVRVQGVVAGGKIQIHYLTPSCLSLDRSDLPPIAPVLTPGKPQQDTEPSRESPLHSPAT